MKAYGAFMACGDAKPVREALGFWVILGLLGVKV